MAGQGSGIRPLPLFAAGFGVLLLWSAVAGKKWSSVLRDIISGKNPETAQSANPILGTSSDAGAIAAGNSGNVSSGSAVPAGPVNPNATSYTHSQLEGLWVMAGGSQAAANNAACHAIQESAGNPRATSANPDGGTNVGLWQLDTPGGKGAGYTISELMNPLLNARITVRATNNGRDWSAWATPGC